MHPTRCLSSHLTTELLTFRNPHGGEENWLNGNQPIETDIIFMARVFTTEIGVALLCVTATVESVAYLILMMGGGLAMVLSFPLSFIYERPFRLCQTFAERSRDLIKSSTFTVYWNFGNMLVFNIFCVNVFTQEAFARYSIDHEPRGQFYKLILRVMDLALMFSMLFTNNGPHRPIYTTLNLDDPWLRPEDNLYIVDWANTHQAFAQHQIGLLNPQAQQLVNGVHDLNQTIDEGTAFFKECLLHPGQIDDDTRERVLEFDADVCVFVLTRSIYIYVFGSKREDAAPFFKLETQLLIKGLREKYEKDEGAPIEFLMQDLLSFDADQDDEEIKTVLNELKGAAHGELQNSLFLTKCWQNACTEFDQDAQNSNDLDQVAVHE